MSSNDLAAEMSIDTSEFIAPVEKAADAAEDSGDRIITIIHKQEGSWLSAVTAIVPEIGRATAAVATFAAAHLQLIKQRELITALNSSWSLSGAAVYRYSRLAISAIGMVNPYVKAIGIGITAATIAYKVGTSEVVQNAVRNSEAGQRVIATYGQMTSASQRLTNSSRELASSGLQAAQDGFLSLAASATEGTLYLLQFDPSIQAANYGLLKLADGMEWAAKAADELNEILPTVKLYVENFGNVSAEAAAKFYEEGQALKQLAADTEARTAKIEGQRSAFQSLLQIQNAASNAAANAAEVAKVSSLTTIEAIEAETHALRERAAAAIVSGDPIDDGHLRNMFNALANQKEGVESGKIKPGQEKDSYATQQIEAAELALQRLTMSETDYALAVAKAKGATDPQLAALREKLTAVEAVKDVQNQLKEAEAAAVAAAAKQAAQQEAGTQKIESMRDQIDLLTGAASKADIAMREMARQGFSQDQIEEVGKLQAELDELEKKDPKNKTGAGKANTAALAGTSAAADIILRGVGTPAKNNTDILIAKQTAAAQQMAARLEKGLTVEFEEVTLA